MSRAPLTVRRMAVLTERKVWRRERREPRKRSRNPAQNLTERQQANVRHALEVLRIRLGSWAELARAMGVLRAAVSRVVRGVTAPHAGYAMRAARVAGVPVDDIISGEFVRSGTCPFCGRPGALVERR